MQMSMKRLLFLIAFLGTMGSLWAQTVENLFEWQGENGIVAKPKFLGLSRNQELPNMPLYTYMEYDVHSDNGDSYCIKMRGVGNKEMSKGGDYDFFEIHHNGKMILRYYNPQIQISAESETKRSIFREKDKTKRSKKESAQHSKSRNKSFVMTSVSAL